MNEKNVGIILLAAGASTRMGEPKQLLAYQGESLLCRAVRISLASGCRPVVVVLGSEAEKLRSEIDEQQIVIAVNSEWEAGMASSIRAGLEALGQSDDEKIEAVMLLLCDQPYVTATTINCLLEAYQTGSASIVASAYDENGSRNFGVPALFGRDHFPELLSLSGMAGAKPVIARHLEKAILVNAPEAAFDVDTPMDYQVLRSS